VNAANRNDAIVFFEILDHLPKVLLLALLRPNEHEVEHQHHGGRDHHQTKWCVGVHRLGRLGQ
jgi:hypothetical protein